MLIFSPQQATDLGSLFDKKEANITVLYLYAGHSGSGLYAWDPECPEESSVLLGEPDAKPPVVGPRIICDRCGDTHRCVCQ